MLGRHLQGTSHVWHGSTEGEGTPAFGTQYSEWVPARQRGTAREPPRPRPLNRSLRSTRLVAMCMHVRAGDVPLWSRVARMYPTSGIT